MFDTNIFNEILDGKISLQEIQGTTAKFWITHLQYDELNSTKNEDRRNGLLKTFQQIDQTVVPTESAVFDISVWDQAKWTSQDNLYEPILNELNTRQPGRTRSHTRDALIAETAIKNKCLFVSNDKTLYSIVEQFKGEVCTLEELKVLI